MTRKIALVTGATSGLGLAVAHLLSQQEDTIVLRTGWDPQLPVRPYDDYIFNADLTDPEHITALADWAKQVKAESYEDEYPVLVNCAGINYIEWFEHLDWEMYEKLQRLNVRAGIELTQKLMSPEPPFDSDIPVDSFFTRYLLHEREGTILNIVSNASHVPMTNSVAYNASKGAFHIATLAMARELRKTHNLCIFGISPNKLAGTEMSSYIEDRVPGLRGWSSEEAAKYQLSALPAGAETDPFVLAEFIAFLLECPYRHKFLTNTVIPYGA